MALNLGNLYYQVGAKTSGLKRAEQDVGRFATQTEKNFNRTSKAAKRLGAAIAAVVSVEAARRAVMLADTYVLLDARIRVATKATGDYNRVAKELYEISQRNGTSLASNVTLFQDLARIAPELGATTTEVLKLSEVVGQLGVIGGSSAEQMKNGLLQFTQGLASGIFRAEELNSILENMPEVANRIAHGLGLGIGQLRKMVLDGKLLSSQVFESLLKQTEDIQTEFNSMPLTIDRAFVQLTNSFMKFMSRLDSLTGATEGIAELFSDIAEFLEKDFTDSFAGINDYAWEIGERLKLWQKVFAAIYNYLKPIFELMGKIYDVVVGLIKKTGELVADVALKVLEIPANDEELAAIETSRKLRKLAQKEREVQNAKDILLQKQLQKEREATQRKEAELRKQEKIEAQKALEAKQAMERAIKDATPRIEALEQALSTELELENTHYQKSLELLKEAEQLKIDTVIPYHELRERLEMEHKERLKEIDEKYSAESQKKRAIDAFLGTTVSKKANQMTLEDHAKSFRSQIDLAAQHSKKFFALKKAMALATAIIEAPKAILSAYTWGVSLGGPPLGAIFAGISAAATAVQIKAISSAQFSGSRAEGGDVYAGGLYRVNERGAEMLSVGNKDYLMMGNQNGKITPNHQLATSPSVNVNQSIVVNVDGMDLDIEERVRSAAQEGGRLGYELVAEDLLRNGKIRRIL